MKTAIAAGLLVLVASGCGGGGDEPAAVTPPTTGPTFAHSLTEACSAVNYLRTRGADFETVPAEIRATLTGSPLAEAWARHYNAMLVWADTGANDPSDEAITAEMDASSKVLKQMCDETNVTLVGADENYFLPSY